MLSRNDDERGRETKQNIQASKLYKTFTSTCIIIGTYTILVRMRDTNVFIVLNLSTFTVYEASSTLINLLSKYNLRFSTQVLKKGEMSPVKGSSQSVVVD